MKQTEWHGLPFYDIFGRKLHFALRDLQAIVLHKNLALFAVIIISLLVLFNTHGYRDYMSTGATVVLWTISALSAISLYIVTYYLLIKASRRLRWLVVYTPVVSVLLATVNTVVTTYMVSLLADDSFPYTVTFRFLPLNIALFLVFETIFFRFVMPTVLETARDKAGEPVIEPVEAAEPPEIVIAGKKFRADRIDWIESQNHYLEIATGASREFLRARLSDAVSQLSGCDGIMPHRSYWVARASIDGIAGNAGSKTLLLKDGRKIPVARGRVADVTKWLDT